MAKRTDGNVGSARASRTDDEAANDDVPALSRATWAGAACAISLAVIAVLSIVAQDAIQADIVPEDDWRGAAFHIRDQLEPGDAIRVEPVWADTPRVFLDGAEFDLTPAPQRDVLDEFSRVWVIAGFNRAERVHEAMPRAYNRLSVETFGRVDVTLYEVPEAARPRYDFTDSVRNARVRRVFRDGRPPQNCTLWRQDAWHCGRVDQHLFVGRRMRDMNNEPRYCIYAAPVPDARVEILFDSIELHERIEGRYGFDNWAVRSERGGPTSFQVAIDGEPEFTSLIQPRDPEFHHFEIDTSERAGSQASVRFSVDAVDFYDRFMCFTARIPAP